MNYWAFSPCGLFAQGVAVGLCTVGLSVLCGLFCVIDYLPKVLPLGYVLLDFQSVWIVRLIICPRRCHWVMYYWTFSPYGLFRWVVIAQGVAVGL